MPLIFAYAALAGDVLSALIAGFCLLLVIANLIRGLPLRRFAPWAVTSIEAFSRKFRLGQGRPIGWLYLAGVTPAFTLPSSITHEQNGAYTLAMVWLGVGLAQQVFAFGAHHWGLNEAESTSGPSTHST